MYNKNHIRFLPLVFIGVIGFCFFVGIQKEALPLLAPLRWITKPLSIEDIALLNNSLYKNFKIKPPKHGKKFFNVIISVQTAPSARKRRQAIRDTWFQGCVQVNNVVPKCMFFTDEIDQKSPFYKALMEESLQYGDILFSKTPQGFYFTHRLVYQMVYFLINYEFDYYLRVDDDYVLCINQFLQELPYPMEKNFTWAFMGFCKEGVVHPDEGIILFSRDLVSVYMNQDPNKMLCTGYGSCAIGYWTMAIKRNYIFRHDPRVRFGAIPPDTYKLRTIPNVCQRFMAIHHANPDDIRILWKNRGQNITIKGNLKTNSNVCQFDHKFDWKKMPPVAHLGCKPELCISNPQYPSSYRSYNKLE